MNHTAQTLDVAKRRIYDITNVLEGIGLLEKKSKNTIRWQGATSESQESRVKEVDDLRAEVEQLQKLEMEIDSRAQECEQALATMADDPKDRLRSYVTNTDIVSIEGFRGKQLLAIKAPSGTSLEVPDPDEGMKKGKRRYQVYLRSTHGPIDIYMNVGAGKSEIARANSSNANITITRNAAGAAGAMGMSPTRGSSNSLLAPKGRRRAVVGSPAFSPALAAVNGVTMSPLNVGGNAPLDESFILLSPMSFSHGEDFSSVLDEQLEGVADFFQVSGNKVKAH